jgi:tRNA(Ile)-lysidine synthase
MLPLESELAAQLRAHDWQAVTSLVAVSGGADSVALVRGLSRAWVHESGEFSGRLILVHFNHRLRGAASDADACFVAHLAAELGLEAVIGIADESALRDQGESLEAAARDARYRFFEATANERGARYLFTAHTANDQAETILHRILRGTGLDGLAGIPRVRALSPLTTIVRPLLDVTRAEVLGYLSSIGQTYCEDATNTDPRFTRNRIRHELLPQLAEQYNPQIDAALLRLGQLAGEAQACIWKQLQALQQRAVRTAADGIHVSCDLLTSEDPYLVRQLFIELWQQQGWPLQPMTFEKWRQLADFARSPGTGSLEMPGKVRVQKNGAELRLVGHTKSI